MMMWKTLKFSSEREKQISSEEEEEEEEIIYQKIPKTKKVVKQKQEIEPVKTFIEPKNPFFCY